MGLALAAIVGLPILVAVPDFLLPGLAGFLLAAGGLAIFSLRQSRRARLEERVTLWADQLEITTRGPGQQRQLRRFDPKAVRLVLERDDFERTTAMHLRHGRETIEIGAFLALPDKSSFARAFGQALRRARQG